MQTSQRRVVLACFLGLAVSGSPILIYTQGQFLVAMTQEFGWSRSVYFLPLMIGGLLGALLTIPLGAVADREGPRRLLLAGIVLFALLTMAMSSVGGSAILYGAIAICTVLASTIHGPLLYTKAVSEWASDRPGLALAIALAGTAVGAIVTPPLVDMMIAQWGWRSARVALGLLVLIVALPAVFLLVRSPPPELRTRTTDRAASQDSLSFREAIRSRVLIQILLGVFAAAAALNGLLANLMPVLTDRGIAPTVAAYALSAFAFAQIFGRLLSGASLDRIPFSAIGAFWFLLALPGVLLAGYATSTTAIISGAMLLGLALGSELELSAYYTLRFFGARNFGTIYGALIGVFTVGATAGPLAVGAAFDASGDNRLGLTLCLVALGVTILSFLTLGPYRFDLPGNAAGQKGRRDQISPE